MTGETVRVTPPDLYGFGMQGLASLDPSKKQARIILGNAAGAVDVTIKGLKSASFLGSSVHVSVWRVDTSGIQPSSGTVLQQEADYAVSNGEITVAILGAVETSALHLIVTPAANTATTLVAYRYEAEFADLTGAADIAYGKGLGFSGPGFVKGFDAKADADVEFVINAVDDGYYSLALRYSSDVAGQSIKTRKISLLLNGAPMGDLQLAVSTDESLWASQSKTVFLAGRPGHVVGDRKADQKALLDRHGRAFGLHRSAYRHGRRHSPRCRSPQSGLRFERPHLHRLDGGDFGGADSGRHPFHAQPDQADPRPG